MKEKKIYDAITNIPDEYVEEARKTKLRQTFSSWKKWVALAACFALVIGVISLIHQDGSSSGRSLNKVVLPKAYAFEDNVMGTIMKDNPVNEDFLTALNEFSYETSSKILKGESDNVNYSPLSLYYALAMAASGANGETADEILTLLGISDQNTLMIQSRNLYNQLYRDNEIGKLKIANSLWMDKEVVWKNNFIEKVADNFYASTFSMDFSDKETGKLMGKWISENTNGTLEPELEINQEQILSIINTVYFYDEWTSKFDKKETEEDTFYLSDGTTVSCDFMKKEQLSGFSKGEGFTRSSIGLKNAGSMIFILPDEGVSPKDLLSTPEKMQIIFEEGEHSYGEVIWQIPKFSFGTKLDLVETLDSLGVKSAFEMEADFSGITDHMAYITGIHQETHIGIDENGVEASAYTDIQYSGSALPLDSADMILNRPFIYGITAAGGTLLFVGVCENPVDQ